MNAANGSDIVLEENAELLEENAHLLEEHTTTTREESVLMLEPTNSVRR